MNLQPTSFKVDKSGWAYVEEARDVGSMLAFATSIGRPIQDSRGIVVQEVQVKLAEAARPATLSSRFGEGVFPLHTDTAFWPRPARYLVMRASGDLRRTTTVCTVAALGAHIPNFKNLANDAIWLVSGRKRAFYCSTVINAASEAKGFRYDQECMRPVNESARQLDDRLRSLTSLIVSDEIDWSRGKAVVIDNWHALHGRGSRPQQEQLRILQRIYVE